VSVLNIHLAS